MKCPFCGHENTRVIDSRPADENNSIRRRRVCDECEKRFTTYEIVESVSGTPGTPGGGEYWYRLRCVWNQPLYSPDSHNKDTSFKWGSFRPI